MDDVDPQGLGRSRERGVSDLQMKDVQERLAALVPESELLSMLWDQLGNGRDLSVQGPHCHTCWASPPGPVPSPADPQAHHPVVSVTPVARYGKFPLGRL